MGFYGGNRQAEFATLRFENIDWQRAIIPGWEQPKKHGAPRDIPSPQTTHRSGQRARQPHG